MTEQIKPRVIAVLLLFGILAVSCAEYSADWQGSVDAVFRYRPQDSTTAVVETRENSFAAEAGLRSNDLILAVDGKNVTGAAFEEVRAALRGPVGSIVRLTVKRGEQVLDIKIERRPLAKEKE